MFEKITKNICTILFPVLFLAFLCNLAFADISEQELRFRALEEKVEALQPKKTKKGATYNAHGVKKQPAKPTYYYKKGFHFESSDGLFSTNLQWRAQMRFANPSDGDPQKPSDFSKDDTNNFQLRRVRMKVGGHGYKPWLKYYFEVDLQPSRSSVTSSSANSSSRIIDWRIDILPWEQLGFRVGQWKINYNRERVDSSGRQTFVERSIVNRIFTIDRQVGVMAKGRFNKGTIRELRYYAGIFNGEGRSIDNSSDNMMKMARLQWNFLGRDLKWRQSDVKRHKKPTGQIAVAWTGNRGNCTRWSSSGCGSLDGFSVGDSEQFEIDQYLSEFAFKYQGLAIQHEYHWKNIDDNDTGLEHEYEGSYSNIGYFLNEIWPAVPPELELAFRYAFVDEPDPDNFSFDNKREEYTLAFNYFIAGHNNKVTVDYSYLTLDDASSNQSFNDNRIRLQWDISF